MASAREEEYRGLFEKYQKATAMRTALAEMGHQQPPTLVAKENIVENSTVNRIEKRKRYRSIYMISYWVRDRIRQNHFHIFCEEINKNLVDYVTKLHPIWHHRTITPIFLKATQKDIKKIKIPESWDRKRV